MGGGYTTNTDAKTQLAFGYIYHGSKSALYKYVLRLCIVNALGQVGLGSVVTCPKLLYHTTDSYARTPGK